MKDPVAKLNLQISKKEIESYTGSEAREVLLRLIEKNKVVTDRKNWKADETGYLVFIIGCYC